MPSAASSVSPGTTLLVANPGAGRARGGLPEALSRLEALGPVTRIAPDDPSQLPAALRAAAAPAARVVVAGGDGTVNLAAQAAVPLGLPLGVIPLGTANNLARTLGLPDDPAQACDVIVGGRTRRIDVGRVNDRYFLTTASVGLSVRITRSLSHVMKRRWGIAAYAVAAVRALRAMRPFHCEIAWPGGSVNSRTVQVVVGNGVHYGGALRVAEDARIDDASLDLYSLELHRWWHALALLPALRSGRQGERKRVLARRAPWFELTTATPHPVDADGEVSAHTPARFEVLPAALSVYVPDSASA